ncbi:SDR family NAD(P)-dependent oxidoreductase [Streptomyces sp. NPDC057429]|uniref:SDR family NAD(P)-dependent oxidoreductase n=1 Tax=Streptomyces sp. NPDC057429 TaxID=3346130 RepID=UPI0036AF7C0C
MGTLAVVSGGATGIGRAVAERLAAAGADLVLIGRRADRLREAADALDKISGPGRTQVVVADLSVPEDVERAAREITAPGRPVDVLVNNAGGNLAAAPATDLEGVRRDWTANFTGNVLPVVLLTQALLPALRRPGGRIVTVGSIAALRGSGSYGAAKAALHPWSWELALRLAPEGITSNIVAPGYIQDTEFYGERMSPDFHAGRAAQAPMGRGGTVEEVAATVAHLAGPDAGYLTGQIVQINGGAMAGRG